ncbi:MAG: hypothetical protein SFY66_04460 [Oculatellaceae cyanobacterium bins.114]|nr:hypothetical protein [Oculatellaceae cyanobacterium bins.114]
MNTTHSTVNQTQQSHRLVDRLNKVIVIAYKESTEQLQRAIAQEGLQCEVQRQEDKPEYKDYAAAYRCMLNHCRAWEQAAQATQPTMIVEADYVPVVGLGQLPLPFNAQQDKVGIAWLYTCAPQMYSVTAEGFIEGYSTALVAYILTPQGAACLTGLVDEVTQKYGTGYNVFDSYIDRYLRDRGFKNYIPFRNYGEHGGKSNPEHRKNGMSGIHRADVLYNKLAFTPAYAEDESLLFARLKARYKGLARLGTGKFLRTKIVKTSSVPWRLMGTAIRRQLALRL